MDNQMSNVKMSNECILSMGGAFNPVHTQHIETMQMAREYLEKEKGLVVHKGYLAVAHDGYVQNKMKGMPMIKSFHRINMVNLAIKKHEWLSPMHKCYGSAFECASSCAPSDCLKVIVIGADRAISRSLPKWRIKAKKQKNVLNLIIGRPGETEKVKKLWDEDNANGLVTDVDRYIFANFETKDISSTKIRDQLLTVKDKNKCLDNLVENNFLDNQVADYIKQNQNSIFTIN